MSGEFGVHGVEVTAESTAIIGRCFVGPLRLGDVFVRNTLPDGGGEVAVRLTVTLIEAYGHTLRECDEALSARLTLTGDGGATIVDRSVLST